MAAVNLSAALDFIWRPENDGSPWHCTAHDPGLGTAWAVTQATWAAAVEHGYVSGDLRDAAKADCGVVLQAMFWNAIRGNLLPSGPDVLLMDIAVVDGPGRAARFLQRAVGATEDGIIGPDTIRRSLVPGPTTLLAALAGADDAFLRGLPSFKYFGRGWERRLSDCRVWAASLIPPCKSTLK